MSRGREIKSAGKKGLDCSAKEFITIEEGLCVQIMHSGPYDDEPETLEIMDNYLKANGYIKDISDSRRHHEIYCPTRGNAVLTNSEPSSEFR